MEAQFRKIDRQYILSDSSVNEYGFRLLTSGYQLAEYQKNPIGYYMHRRDDGIVLKWEDLCVENDTLLGKPVINLANERGEQTWTEAENGFLNAASVGHIVILDYNMDADMMLPGQTGPTITRWYNKECSLVDIPGNSNALAQLYDAQENEINLADFAAGKPISQAVRTSHCQELTKLLGLESSTSPAVVLERVSDLLSASTDLKLTNEKLNLEIDGYKVTIAGMEKKEMFREVSRQLDDALEHRKITLELRNLLSTDYQDNPEGLKTLLTAMPSYQSIASLLKAGRKGPSEKTWTWDDYEKNDPGGTKLADLKTNDPMRYKDLFDGKFGT